jgi:hypothetical protein
MRTMQKRRRGRSGLSAQDRALYKALDRHREAAGMTRNGHAIALGVPVPTYFFWCQHRRPLRAGTRLLLTQLLGVGAAP